MSRSRQRRSLSAVKQRGRVDSGGDRVLARALAAALTAAQRGDEVAESFTHPFHGYPARMHPATAHGLLAALDPSSVLDPFCGSGTTLVEARAGGIRAAGVDLNPLAVAIARAKTWTVVGRRRRQLVDAANAVAESVLAAGKAARRAGHRPLPHAGDRRRDAALRGWFAPHVRRELEHIAHDIGEVAADDPELSEILRVALSSVLYKVSRRTSDTDPRVVERQVARGAAARLFRDRVALLASGLGDLAEAPGPRPTVVVGDARDLPADLGSFDAVITSPPYAGTYDYVEQHALRLAFLGLPPGRLSSHEIGSRRSFSSPGAAAKVQRDLAAAFGQMARAAPGGVIAVVIGDSIAGGKRLAADDLVRAATVDRFDVVAWAWQERPKVGADRRGFGAAPKREHVIALRARRAVS